MKKFRLFLILAISAFINVSCEDDKDIAVLDNEGAIPSTLITPANESAYVLNLAEGASNFDTFSWTESDYGAVLSRSYSLELDIKGGGFVKPIRLIKDVKLDYTITNAELNLILYDAAVTSTLKTYLRVMTTVKDDNVDTLISNVNAVTLTPYGYNKPNLTAPANESSYVLLKKDSADVFETFEWNAVDYGAVYANKYTLEFDTAGNGFKSAVKLNTSSNTSFSIRVDAMNQALIKKGLVPEVATNVEFRVVATADGKRGVVKSDFITLNLTAYDATAGDPVDEYPVNLHLVGDATDVGWTAANAIPMINNGNGKYSLVANLKGDEGIEGYKFLVNQGSWAPMYAQDGSGTWDAGNLVFRATESDPDPKAIPHPLTTGSYLIELDLAEMTYKVTAQ